jgi:arylsulfatase A-like enzyme
LRRRSRWFTNAFAPGAGTDLSMGGVLTGKLDPMSGAAFTLPELLSAGGLVTHAVIPREVVVGTSKTLLTRGLRGHDILVTDPKTPNVPAGVSSPRTTALALSFLDGWLAGKRSGKEEPFFLWLHYFDIHEHHQLPDKLREIVAHNGGRVPRNTFQKYNALLKITDQALGRLFAGITRRGLNDSTIVVFAADHGESLEEDPRLPKRHGQVLYNPLVHVPLAIAVPGIAGGDQPEPASLIDVPFTLLDLLGLPVPPSMNGGQSLVPNLAGIPPLEDEPPRTFVLNESEQYAVIQWPFKMLMRRKGTAAELYDLSQDFAESTNLARKRPDLVRSLSHAYRAHPAVTLDRTAAGRKRFEKLARRTRPAAQDLARIAEQRARPPADAGHQPDP